MHWPAAKISSRGPILGSASSMDSNGLAVDFAGDGQIGGVDLRVVALCEKIVAHAIGVQRRPVEQRAGGGIRTLSRQHIQVFLGAVIVAGETEQFEEKRSAARVRRIVAQLSAERLDCRRELSGVVEFSGCHE